MLLIYKFQFLQGDQPFGHSFWNHMYVSHASQLLPNDLLATFTNHIFHDIKQVQNKNSIYSQLRTHFKEITINTPSNEK